MNNRVRLLLSLLLVCVWVWFAVTVPKVVHHLNNSPERLIAECHGSFAWHEVATYGRDHFCAPFLDIRLYYETGWFGWNQAAKLECEFYPDSVNKKQGKKICPIGR